MPLPVTIVPASTLAGLAPTSGTIGATLTTLKSAPGILCGWYIYNSNSSVTYVQFFDAPASQVVLGTTTPLMSWGIIGGGGADAPPSPIGIQFNNAITIAMTTTRSGNTAPSNTVDYNFFIL